MADLPQAKLQALEFLKGAGYDADSDAEAIDETFLAAMKSLKEGSMSNETLSVIAKAFSANMAIEDTLYHPEITKAANADTDETVVSELLAFYKAEVGA